MKSVKNAIKKVAKSKIGKALLVGAAIWTGGAAFGLWSLPASVPFSSAINGAFVKGATAAAGSGAAGAATGAATTANTAQIANAVNTTMGVAAPAGSISSAYTLPTMAQSAAAAGSAIAPSSAVQAATAPLTTMGKIGKAAGTIGSFIQNNPTASAIALNTVAGAMTPDEIDLAKQKSEIEQEQADNLYKQRLNNLKVAGINLGQAPQVQSNGILQTSLNSYRS